MPQQCRPLSPLEMPGGRIGAKPYQEKPLLNQCLRPNLAVALVPCVPSVPLIAAIGFAWLFVPLTLANPSPALDLPAFALSDSPDLLRNFAGNLIGSCHQLFQ